MKVDFKQGVSPQVVETMLSEVMDSMVHAGEIKESEMANFDIDGDTIFEICDAVAAILNHKFGHPIAQAISEGFVMVPRVPTAEMINRGRKSVSQLSEQRFMTIWNATLAAAQISQ